MQDKGLDNHPIPWNNDDDEDHLQKGGGTNGVRS